jgi:hypothetical protein
MLSEAQKHEDSLIPLGISMSGIHSTSPGPQLPVIVIFYRHVTPPESGSYFGLRFMTPAGSNGLMTGLFRGILRFHGLAAAFRRNAGMQLPAFNNVQLRPGL